MNSLMTVGQAARETGLSARTIRFYEDAGVVHASQRSDSGYRLYTPTDVRRLRLARNAKLLGLSLAEIGRFVESAFSADCRDYSEALQGHIGAQRSHIDRQLSELADLRLQLDRLEQHLCDCTAAAGAGCRVEECEFCPLIDKEGGENDE